MCAVLACHKWEIYACPLQPADDELGKALFYRLLSLAFRQFIASKRDQNINNLNLSDLSGFGLTLPVDRSEFFKTVTEKETALMRLEAELAKLKSRT